MAGFFKKINMISSRIEDGSMRAEFNEQKSLILNPNRSRFFSTHHVPENRAIGARIAHGGKVAVVKLGDWGITAKEADALVTCIPDFFMWITNADCYPVGLYGNGISAIAHGGYKPLAAEILSNTVKKMVSLGAYRRSIYAKVGAGICEKCYDFSVEDLEKLGKYNQKRYINSLYDTNEKVRVNLPLMIKDQLLENDIPGENIFFSNECTCCNPQKYFSARRDKKEPPDVMITVVKSA